MRRLLARRHLNRLQRKVVLLVLVIILIPMVVTGMLSASWVTQRMETTTEGWIREAAQVNRDWLNTLNRNSELFADLYRHLANDPARLAGGDSPIPPELEPLASELGINLVQVFDPEGRQIYSSPRVSLGNSWQPGEDNAILKVTRGDKSLLAAVTILRTPDNQAKHYRLVFGTLFDQHLLERLSKQSGLKTRLFYPRNGDFANAFSEESTPLKLRLPSTAFNELQQQHDYFSNKSDKGKYWGLYTPVAGSDGHVEAVLFSGLQHHGGDELLTDQTLLFLAVFLLGGLLAGVTGVLISRLVVRPVTYLHEGVMKVAAQDFRTSVPIYWHDEIGDLARAFNSMAANLRQARDRQQQEFQRDKIASLGELSLAMAHEIRNPLGVINTAAKLLEKSDDPNKRNELQRMIREEAHRLDHFLRDFQQLARHRQPQFSLIDPATPLQSALKVTLAGRDDVRLEYEFHHHDRLIRADAELLQQAWVNLINNALAAMNSRGRLRVGSDIDGDEVLLYLHDSGPGIPVDIMTRLFEPFFTTKAEGSGLGLTLANTLVTASGASLELVPHAEPGARFAMRFHIVETD